MGLIVALAAAPLPTWRPSAAELIIVALGIAVAGFLWYADIIRPGSFRRRGGRDTAAIGGDGASETGVPWHLWFLAAIVTFLTLLTTVGITATLAGVVPGEEPGLRAQGIVGLTAYSVGGIAGAALVWLFASRVPPRRAGLRLRATDIPVGLAIIGLAAPVILAVSVLAPTIYGVLTGEPPDPVAHTQLRLMLEGRADADPWIWALVFAAAVGAPIVEELINRVFLQSSILILTRSHWAAILITSILFTLTHAGSVPVYAMPVLFTLSVAIGAAYERTARLGVPIVMHAAFNTANLAVTLAAA